MIIVMKPNSTAAEIGAVIAKVQEDGVDFVILKNLFAVGCGFLKYRILEYRKGIATIITLLLIPSLYMILEDLKKLVSSQDPDK